MNLTTIKVLWRQSDTMALYGIPYEMRPGQSPSDLTKGSTPDGLPLPYGTLGAPYRAPGPRADWVWLGSPGWWGSMSPEDQASVQAFLKAQGDNVPQGPNEWSRVAYGEGPHPCPNCQSPVSDGPSTWLCLECASVKAAHDYGDGDDDYPGETGE